MIVQKNKKSVLKDQELGPAIRTQILIPIQNLWQHIEADTYLKKAKVRKGFKIDDLPPATLSPTLIEAEILTFLLPDFNLQHIFNIQEEITDFFKALVSYLDP